MFYLLFFYLFSFYLYTSNREKLIQMIRMSVISYYISELFFVALILKLPNTIAFSKIKVLLNEWWINFVFNSVYSINNQTENIFLDWVVAVITNMFLICNINIGHESDVVATYILWDK